MGAPAALFMQCLQCRAENRESRRFCAACGAALLLHCPACHFANEPGERFCGGCGRSLTAPPRVAETRSPGAYTPKHLADRILTSRAAMEGERKHVTVLFCDLVDSSRLAEQLDPEAMHQTMDRVLRLMAEAVHRYDGTVNQFLGDGLMALFGAPLALEDHALRAVHAALAIQETLAGYSAQLQRERGVAVRLRIGLNTGPVVVGRIGDDLRMDYTAVGDTTHLAARLQALAEPDAILMGETTHRAVQGYVRTDAVGPVQIRGRTQPVTVYRVLGRRRRRSRLEVRVERGLTPLVGRSRELGLLRDCFERAREGRGQVVGILGEPGVGKSRLLFEFRDTLLKESATWLEGQCSPYGQSTPYLPILDILRTSFEIEEGDNPLQLEEKLRRGIRALDPSLETMLPLLRDLFHLPVEDEALKHLDPAMKRRQTFEAIRALTAEVARQRPLVLVLEDLHWADKASEEFLTFFVGGFATIPVLLATTQRPGYSAPWTDRSWYRQLAIDTLSNHETETMITGLLGARDIPGALVGKILEKAEGNPLSVEEIVASLVERQAVIHDGARVRWSAESEIDFPATIQDVVRARIDRLDETLKEVLQCASVIGRVFRARLLTRLADVPGQIDEHLGRLKQYELIHDASFFPEPEFTFKHAVIQDVVYQSLLSQRRAELHAAAGEAFEALYPDQLEENAGRIVPHYRLGGRPDKVLRYAVTAGDRAARLHATAEAKAYYELALDAVTRLPASADIQRAEIDAILKLAAVGGTRQDIERDQTNLERARAVAEALHDEPRLARVLYWLGRLQYVRWNPQAAIDYAQQSLEIGERLGDDAILAPPVNLMGRIHWIRSDYGRASQMLERSVAQMQRLGNKGEQATAAATAGCVFGLMGEFERATAFGTQGVELAREIRNPFAEAAAYCQRAIVYDQQGDWEHSLADHAVAREVATRVGDLFRLFVVKSWEGRARTVTGDAAAGRVLVQDSLDIAAKIGTRLTLPWQKTFLASCHLALGETEAAVEVSAEAVRIATETGDRTPLALAHRTFAEAIARQDPAARDTAETSMREAIRILEEIGALPELARTYASYARVLGAWGSGEQAVEFRARAGGMFETMGMAWDLARLQR
jgi:class 3 adenylate cyclase/tetratricopeptide (TPR) repeat protein